MDGTKQETEASTRKQNARDALERVCSGKGLDKPGRYYASCFVDHVNDVEFHGLEGAERSVGLYRSVFREMSIHVEEQVTEGDLVTSRFLVSGTSYGRDVRFSGITMSRFRDGKIVEDWSVTDTLGMLRQLGVWRTALLGIRTWTKLRAA
jgi:predicted ester cyclase